MVTAEHMDKAAKWLDAVEAEPGRLKKEALLLGLQPGPLEIVQELFSMALDPFRLFGIQDIPEWDPSWTVDGTEHSFAAIKDWVAVLESKPEGLDMDSKRARTAALFCSTGDLDKWLRRALLKNMRCGVSYSTVEKLWPGLVKTFSCMLATEPSTEELDALTYPVVAEPKIDGIRCVALIKDGEVDFISRGGKPLYHLDTIRDALRGLDDVAIDGELFAGSFNDTMKVVRRSKNAPDPELHDQLMFWAFDVVLLEDWNAKECKTRFRDRRRHLCSILPEVGHPVMPVVSMSVQDRTELDKIAQVHLLAGHEGSMLKTFDHWYSFGRSKEWLKYKPFFSGDYKCVGYYEGHGKHVGRLGGLVIVIGDGVLCKVGGGFSDKLREKLYANPPLGQAIEVKYKEMTPDGSLREPVFRRVRSDK